MFDLSHNIERNCSNDDDLAHGASSLTAPQTELKLKQILVKRFLDVVVSAAMIMLLSPLLFLVALAVKLESSGPILFVQERWGKDCQKIKIYKFRTMRFGDGDETGKCQTVVNDPRLTRIGHFLRSTNLDELPQLLNILFGNMSFVGPRCHPIAMMAAGMPYEKLVPTYHMRHAVKPGLTGLAQINGLRGPTIDVEHAIARVQYDHHYVRYWNIGLDLKIIGKTLLQEMRGGTGF